MSENFEPKTDLLIILNSFIQLLMLLSVMTIAVLRFINTCFQLKTNDLKNEYFMNKNKKKWKQYIV
jgi:hypothetical protein